MHVGEHFVDRYTIVERTELADGTVRCAARDARAERDVIIRIAAADGIARQRMRRECQAIGKFRSEHAARLFDHGETEQGWFYLIYEATPGVPLAELIAERGLDKSAAIHIANQLLRALEEAHLHGVVHRGITPGAVSVFAYQGDPYRVKLTDFGLARSMDTGAQPALTAPATGVGDVNFAAPEQLAGAGLSPATDLYGIGVLLTHALMGSRALNQAAWRPAHGLRHELFDQIDPALRSVIATLLSAQMESRPQTAAAVRSALQTSGANVAASTSIPSAPTTNTTHDTPATQRPSLVPVFAIATVIALGLLAVLLLTQSDPPTPQARPRAPAPPTPPRPATPAQPAVPVPTHPDVAAEPTDCPNVDEAPFFGPGTLHDKTGAIRDWPVYVPDSYDSRRHTPVVVLFPEDFMGAAEFLAVSGFAAIADEHGFLVAALDVPKTPDPTRADMPLIDDSDTTMVGVDAALESMSRELCIDPGRVYAVSHGAGALPALRLGCQGKVAGVAMASWTLTEPRHNCPEGPPVPFMALFPTRSPYTPLKGGPSCGPGAIPRISVHRNEQLWVKRNRCKKSPSVTFEYLDSACHTYDCQVPFDSCHLDGGGRWPGMAARPIDAILQCDGPLVDFPSAERIWAFFERVHASAHPDHDADE